LGVVSLFAKEVFQDRVIKTEIVGFIYAKAYETWEYFDQLTLDRGNPAEEAAGEWNPAYQAAATRPEVLPSTTLRIVRTKMGSQDSASGIMN
jgi:hypothetical protein